MGGDRQAFSGLLFCSHLREGDMTSKWSEWVDGPGEDGEATHGFPNNSGLVPSPGCDKISIKDFLYLQILTKVLAKLLMIFIKPPNILVVWQSNCGQ